MAQLVSFFLLEREVEQRNVQSLAGLRPDDHVTQAVQTGGRRQRRLFRIEIGHDETGQRRRRHQHGIRRVNDRRHV